MPFVDPLLRQIGLPPEIELPVLIDRFVEPRRVGRNRRHRRGEGPRLPQPKIQPWKIQLTTGGLMSSPAH